MHAAAGHPTPVGGPMTPSVLPTGGRPTVLPQLPTGMMPLASSPPLTGVVTCSLGTPSGNLLRKITHHRDNWIGLREGDRVIMYNTHDELRSFQGSIVELTVHPDVFNVRFYPCSFKSGRGLTRACQPHPTEGGMRFIPDWPIGHDEPGFQSDYHKLLLARGSLRRTGFTVIAPFVPTDKPLRSTRQLLELSEPVWLTPKSHLQTKNEPEDFRRLVDAFYHCYLQSTKFRNFVDCLRPVVSFSGERDITEATRPEPPVSGPVKPKTRPTLIKDSPVPLKEILSEQSVSKLWEELKSLPDDPTEASELDAKITRELYRRQKLDPDCLVSD